MGFCIKDLLAKQAYCRMKMGVPTPEVLEAFKTEELTTKEQEDLRIEFQLKYCANDIEYDN